MPIYFDSPPPPPEGFKLIPGLIGYSISKTGEVMSCRTTGACSKKGLFSPWREMRLTLMANGYKAVNVRIDSESRMRYAHRLVLETWDRAPLPGEEASHLNGCRTDNRLENLIWESRKSNLARREEHGTLLVGTDTPRAKLNESKIKLIDKLHDECGLPIDWIAESLGVGSEAVSLALRRRAWRHVPRARPYVPASNTGSRCREFDLTKVIEISLNHFLWEDLPKRCPTS